MRHILAWHFTGNTLRDGRPIPAVGEWLVHEGPIAICCTGLHASERLIDALSHAPGNTLHRVTMRGIENHGNDKLVARERRIDWSLGAEPILRQFSRRVALDVAHLWDMPGIVRRYLETDDESIRDAAWDAAWDATCDAGWAAAWAAARVAARYGGWDAPWAAARAAARAAALAAGSARDAAWDASLSKYNDWLTKMVMQAHEAAK